MESSRRTPAWPATGGRRVGGSGARVDPLASINGSIGAWRPIGAFSQLYGYLLDRCRLRADVQRNHFWGGCGNRALFAHRFVAECQVLQPLFGEDIGVSGQGTAARNQFPDIFVSHGSNAIIQKKFVIDPATGPAPDTGFVSIAEVSERSHPYLGDLEASSPDSLTSGAQHPGAPKLFEGVRNRRCPGLCLHRIAGVLHGRCPCQLLLGARSGWRSRRPFKQGFRQPWLAFIPAFSFIDDTIGPPVPVPI